MALPPSLALVYDAAGTAPQEVPLDDVYAGLEPAHPAGRPAVILNMVQTLDGAVAIDDKAWTIGSEVDHYLFRVLRGWADVVLSGAGTLRKNDVVPLTHPHLAARRRAQGRPGHPTGVVVSRRAAFEDAVLQRRFFTDRAFASVVVTTDRASIEDRRRVQDAGAEVVVVPSAAGGDVDLTQALAVLSARGVRRVLAEGGPELNRHLVAAGLVDELFVTVTPAVAADAAGRRVVRGLLGGAAARLDLLSEYQYRTPRVREWYLRFRVAGLDEPS